MDNNLMKKIRRAAAKQGEAIRTGRDAYGDIGYMVIDANRNVIISGEGFTMDIDDLKRDYEIE